MWQVNWKLATAVGVAAYLLFMLMTFPAARVYAWWLSGIPELEVAAVEGSIWSGGALGVRVGDTTVRSLRWHARPLQLLRLRPTWDLDARLEEGFVRTRLAVTPGGAIDLRDVQGQFPLPLLAPVLELPPNMLRGEVNVGFDRLLINGLPRYAEGRATLGDAAFRIGRNVTALGHFIAEVDTGEDGVLMANIRDRGEGPLRVEGTASLDPQTDDYRVDLNLRARDTESSLADMLSGVGQGQADGTRLLQLGGSLR